MLILHSMEHFIPQRNYKMSKAITCQRLAESLKGFSMINTCDSLKNGTLRVSTMLKYPNGAYVDVFLKPSGDLFNSIQVSDMGVTTDFLSEMMISLKTPKRLRYIQNCCQIVGVNYRAGSICTTVSLDEIGVAILNLSQACIRVSDLIINQSFRSSSFFNEDIEDFLLVDLQISQKRIAKNLLLKTSAREIEFPFVVDISNSERNNSMAKAYLKTISTTNNSSAVRMSHDLFVDFYDINSSSSIRSTDKLVAIIDTASTRLKDSEIVRLEDVCQNVILFPEESDKLAKVVVAA